MGLTRNDPSSKAGQKRENELQPRWVAQHRSLFHHNISFAKEVVLSLNESKEPIG